MVNNGALHVEDRAHVIVRGMLADYLLGNAARATPASGGGRSVATAVTAWRRSCRGDSGDGPMWQQ